MVTTLWSVDDVSTRDLMVRFYTYLQRGMGKAGALRQAQRDLRTQNPDVANAYFWAAFVLSGDAK